MATSTRWPRTPATRPAHSPSMGMRPSSVSPSSVKNSMAAPRSSTTNPTLAIRVTVKLPAFGLTTHQAIERPTARDRSVRPWRGRGNADADLGQPRLDPREDPLGLLGQVLVLPGEVARADQARRQVVFEAWVADQRGDVERTAGGRVELRRIAGPLEPAQTAHELADEGEVELLGEALGVARPDAGGEAGERGAQRVVADQREVARADDGVVRACGRLELPGVEDLAEQVRDGVGRRQWAGAHQPEQVSAGLHCLLLARDVLAQPLQVLLEVGVQREEVRGLAAGVGAAVP